MITDGESARHNYEEELAALWNDVGSWINEGEGTSGVKLDVLAHNGSLLVASGVEELVRKRYLAVARKDLAGKVPELLAAGTEAERLLRQIDPDFRTEAERSLFPIVKDLLLVTSFSTPYSGDNQRNNRVFTSRILVGLKIADLVKTRRLPTQK